MAANASASKGRPIPSDEVPRLLRMGRWYDGKAHHKIHAYVKEEPAAASVP